MAAVNLPAAFGYKWGENGAVDAMDDSQYKLGWAFIGATPPSVEQFNKVLQTIDEKANYLNSRRIGNYQTMRLATGAITLTIVDTGSIIRLDGGTSVVLPLGATLLAGNKIAFIATDNGRTVTRQGSDPINAFGSGNLTSVTLDNGDSLELTWSGTGWNMTGGSAALRYSSKFSSSLNGIGWKLHPDGAIEQWGTISLSGTNTSAVVTLPTPWPNLYLSGVASDTGNSAYPAAVQGAGLSQINLFVPPYIISPTNGSINPKNTIITVAWRVIGR